jgi:hypothetical protein
MKKILLVSAVLFAVVAVFGAAGLAYAQTQTPGRGGRGQGMMGNGGGYGPGMMGGRGGRGAGMMGSGQYGPMHTFMVEALAEALNLTPEAVQERITNGETPWEIAQSTGLSDDQVRDLLHQVHDTALDKAVAAGAIPQDQADWMEEHMDTMWENGFGPGVGPCHQ